MTPIREGGVEIPAVTQADYQRALSIDAWLIGPGSLDAAARAFARHRIAYTPTPFPEIAEQPMGEDVPEGMRWQDGIAQFQCRVCDHWTEWCGDVADYDPNAHENVCGGSPRCCP